MKSTSFHKHSGGCHCGNIRMVVELATTPRETAVRACQCSFCRAHGVRTASDPAGTLKLWAQDWTETVRYRFGTNSADLLICRKCGVFVAAIADMSEGVLGVVNVNALSDQAQFTAQPETFDPNDEPREHRQDRWAKTWMRAIVHT